MSVLESRVDVRSDVARENRAHMEGLVAELRERLAVARPRGGERATERHRARGKMLARERDGLPLARASAFLELSPLAALGLYGDDAPSAGIVTGIGQVHGQE